MLHPAKMKVGTSLVHALSSNRIALDTKGHSFDHGEFRDAVGIMFALDHTAADTQAAQEAVENKTAPPITVRPFCKCRNCGTNVLFNLDAKSLTAKSPCVFPDGPKPFVTELNVHSGNLVLANDLREEFPIAKDFNIGHLQGMHDTTMEYAKAGLAHAYVGNTCPIVFRHPGDKFTIGQPPHKGSRKVAQIVTGLWWYSLCDRADLADPGDHKYVKCRPGVYRITHQYHMAPDAKGAVYATLEWVREPEPRKDLRARYNSLDFTAGQIIQASIEKYPSLYKLGLGGDDYSRTQQIQRVIDHILVTNGNGHDIHPNGWIGPEPDPVPSDFHVPLLEGRFRWYPCQGWCLLSELTCVHPHVPAKEYRLNPSFTDLCFNVCRNILLYGAEENEVILKRWAKKWLKGLAQRYPVPPYAQDLL